MAVTGVRRRSTRGSSAEDHPGYCARPACRAEFRRIAVAGRPNRYCSDECRHAVRTERKSVEARIRHAEGLLAQARADLNVFDADDRSMPVSDEQRALVAIAQARTALRYIQDQNPPGLAELRELVEAVETFLPLTAAASVA